MLSMAVGVIDRGKAVNGGPHHCAGFNGGKMNHIFEFDQDRRGLYKEQIASEEAEMVFQHGKVFYKIDGSNGMIIGNCDGHLEAFERLDTKQKPIPEKCIALPNGANARSHEGHSYCYQPINLDVEGKKLKKRNQAMLDVVERNKDHILSLGMPFVSIEWVGSKFNKTPGVPHDVAVAIHSEQVCEEEFDRSFSGVRDFLLRADPPIEGLVFEYGGAYWKIRADCFDQKCDFKVNNPLARPPKFLA